MASERGVTSVSVRFAGLSASPLFWWACFTVGFAIAAAALPTDASFDFKNYHFYNGFAAFHDRRGLDIVPAQLQTSFFYGLDPIYYLIFTRVNGHPKLINIILSIPYSVAATAIFVVARLLARPAFAWPNFASAAAAVLGLTGASTLPTLATTASDVVPGLPILIALARWLTLESAGRNTIWTALGVGAVAGISVGLKLTEAPLFVGMALAMALRYATGKGLALLEAFAFGLGGLIVFTALDGAWLWGNAKAYGNPIFPLMNSVFRSDLVEPTQWTDLRFMPTTPLMALFYPAYWAFHASRNVSELAMRDPRILLGSASAVIVIVAFAARWLRDRAAPPIGSFGSLALFLAIAFLVSYGLWEMVWSIYRYLAIQESLSGILMLAALPIAFGARGRPLLLSGLFALIVIWTARTTQYPWWNRAQRGPQALTVQMPPLDSDAMVIFLDPQPYAYLVPSMPNTARAIGVNNNLVHPGASGRLWSIILKAVRDHHGPLWGVEDPKDQPGVADASLSSLGLARNEKCVPLITNMETAGRIRICKLRREQTQ
jgi:uncharacterized membrane protein